MFAFQEVQQKACSCKGFLICFCFFLLDRDCSLELIDAQKTIPDSGRQSDTYTHIERDTRAWEQLMFLLDG